MRLTVFAAIAGVLFVVPAGVSAQDRPAPEPRVTPDTTTIEEITLRDGTTLIGRIVRVGDTDVTVRTLGGLEITVRRNDVIGIRSLRGTVRVGEFWEEDPSDSRLFIGPTARVPQAGRGYIGVYELFIASGAVGLGGPAMIAGGVSLIPGLDLDEQVFYVAPKVQLVNLPAVQAAAGLFWVKPGTSEESAGLVFGSVTGGSRDAALSVGVGYPFASEAGFADDPLVMVGGEFRASRRLKLISENWIVPGEDAAVLSFGFRIIARNLTVEAGAVTTTEGGGFLPIVNFSAAW
jgi:hypothetical protein